MSDRDEAVEELIQEACEEWTTLDLFRGDLRRLVEAGIRLGEERGRDEALAYRPTATSREELRRLLADSHFNNRALLDEFHAVEQRLANATAEGARVHADKLRTAIAENEMLQRQLGEAQALLKEFQAHLAERSFNLQKNYDRDYGSPGRARMLECQAIEDLLLARVNKTDK